VLNIDDTDNRPSLATVLQTASFYGLTDERAGAIVDEVVHAVATWPDVARRAAISEAEIELTQGAFTSHV
jgi:serine/threonine-protein kinase HipA